MKNVALFTFLILVQILSFGQKKPIKILFPDADKSCLIKIQLNYGKYSKSLPFNKETTIQDSLLNNYSTGYISVYDTLMNKSLIQFPVVIDDSLNQIIISKYTLDPGEIKDVITYHSSPSNNLSIDLFLNRKIAYAKYGIEVEGGRYLDGRCERRLLDENLNLISHHTDNMYSLIFLKEYVSGMKSYLNTDNVKKFRAVFEQLSPQLMDLKIGKEAQHALSTFEKGLMGSQIGSSVPTFEIEDLYHQSYSNRDFSGIPYILAFSATWCAPCKENIPLLKSLYNKYQQDGLKVLYVNLHDDDNELKNMIEEYKMDWINLSEHTKFKDSKISKDFNVTAIPNYILIDRHGKIIYNDKQLNDPGFKLLEEYITKSLNNKEF